MAEFTNTELHRIDQLYGNDFKVEDFTLEDLELIKKWEQKRAAHDEKVQAEIKARESMIEEQLQMSRELNEKALSNLNEHAERCRKRWKDIRNGQEKQG